ncbi:unnamed protein product [Brugia pahangi]|uniref:Phospholipase A2 n=1 Tax=Brugia pahangi TaxID=6280 RepID=A0A0N4T5Q5_BRUPA|nr:unnamed protein product [Brugia pahangi]
MLSLFDEVNNNNAITTILLNVNKEVGTTMIDSFCFYSITLYYIILCFLQVDVFKNMYHIFKIFLLLITAHHSWTSKYYCGPSDNAFYRFLSQLLTIPCEQHRINSCCLKHDQCYDDCSVTQLACDTLFCDCLKNIQTNFYCRRIIQPIHCNFPQWFGKSYKCNSRRERCTLENESEDKNRTQ